MAKEVLTTPVGEASWVWATKPDERFQPVAYKASLILEAKESTGLQATIDDAIENALVVAKAKAPKKKFNITTPYEPVLDEDGEDTGKVIFKFKQRYEVKPRNGGDSFFPKIVIYDTGNANRGPAPIDIGDRLIGNGSQIAVGFELVPWEMSGNCSVSLRLRSIQIVKLVEYGNGGGDFQSYDNGFQGEDKSAEEKTPVDAGGKEQEVWDF
jgi:hypothetical protein